MENLVPIGIDLVTSEVFIALVTAFSTAGLTVFLQRYRERRKAWNAIQVEIKSNKRRANDLVDDLIAEAKERNKVRTTDHLGEVNKFKVSSYENAVNSGLLISLPQDLQDDIFEHYEQVEKINRLIETRENLESDFNIISGAFAIILQSVILVSEEEINCLKNEVENFNMLPQNQQTKQDMISFLENSMERNEKGYKFDNLEENLSSEIEFF